MAGPQSQAFSPRVSVKKALTAVSSRIALDKTGALQPDQVRITVDGTDNAYLAFGDVTVTADATDMFVLTGTTEVLTLPPSTTHIAGISDAASGCTVYLTSGNGM